MAKELTRTLSMVKSAIQWDSEAVIEIIDYTVQEFPHWKPEDFMLMCRMVRQGEYKTQFEHSVDYPTFIGWMHKYDHSRVAEIEKERIIDVPAAPELPEKNYTQEEVDQYTRDFYQMMQAKQKAREKEPVPEPYDQYLTRKARQAYREEAERVSLEEDNRYMRDAAKELWKQQNNEVEWVREWISKNT